MEPKAASESAEEPKEPASTEALPPPPVAPEETAPKEAPELPQAAPEETPAKPEPTTTAAATEAPEQQSPAAQAQQSHKDHGKAGLIVSTVMVMIILSALTIFAYMQSQ